MTEPVTLDDIKQHLVLDADITDEDARLASMITAARRACEKRMNRSVIGSTRTLVLDAFPSQRPNQRTWPFLAAMQVETLLPDQAEIVLPGGTVASYTIAYYDPSGTLQTLGADKANANLAQTPAIIRPATYWPQTALRPDAVQVSYTISAMEPDDLEMVRHAIRLLLGHWYANREAVMDTRGTAVELPMQVTWLLEPLRIWSI